MIKNCCHNQFSFKTNVEIMTQKNAYQLEYTHKNTLAALLYFDTQVKIIIIIT